MCYYYIATMKRPDNNAEVTNLEKVFDDTIYLNLLEKNTCGYITQYGRVQPCPEYAMNRRLSRHLIDYIVSGSGYVEYDGREYQVREGDLVYMRKGLTLCYGADQNDPYDKLWIGADGPVVDAMAELYLGGRDIVVIHGYSNELFTKLKNEFNTIGYDERVIMHTLLNLFLTLGGVEEQREYNKHSELAVKIKNYIDRRINERLSLDEAAEYFHVSKRHLIRVFKERFEMTPGAYHNLLRLETATHYLTNTKRSVGEIAAALGYCDQSFFSTAFKKQYGVYPLAYRAQNSN